MNARNPYQDRRSNSQVMPRVYLFLQLFIMALLSYIAYTLLLAMKVEVLFIYIAMFFTNIYILNNIFNKCRSISKRSAFAKRFNY